ncbi:lipopolysaccharide biosynthesis protein [Hyphococcus formosus]|uniref:lipopolysaccharide biosynthesis protein n=1 Tax=Hyphococcus formosus TaxID=3143534 RepID=UPI00398AD744
MSKTPDTPEPAQRPLGERVARGAAWIILARFVIRTLGLINTLILARLLVPADFGIVAVGLALMQLLQNVSDIGVSQTVVKFRKAGRVTFDTLFTMSAIRGAIVCALLLIAAPMAGHFYDDPRAVNVFLLVSIVPVFHALINPRFFEFERDLDFSKEFMTTALNKLLGIVFSITIAVIFQSYLAILAGLIVSAFSQTVLSYIVRPYLPRFTLKAFKELFGFTGWLTGVSFMAALNNKLDMLFLTKLIGPTNAGAYYLGDSIAALPSQEVATPIARAIYPGLSELQSKPENMREAYLRGVEVLGLIAMPAAFGSSFVAADLVAILLGDQWELAVPMVKYFTPVAGLMVLFSATQGYAMACGRTQLIFLRELIYFIIRMPIFIWASAVYGLMGAVLATAAGGVLHMLLNLSLFSRISGRPFYELIFRVRRSFAGVAVMALYFVFIRPEIDAIEMLPLLPRFVCDVAVGAGLYMIGLVGFWFAEGRPAGVERSLWRQISSRFIAQ